MFDQHQHRPRVQDFPKQDPGILEQIRTEERIKQSVKLPEEGAHSFQGNEAFIKVISGVLYDMGRDYYHLDKETWKLTILRHVSGHLKSRLLSGLDDSLKTVEFANYIDRVNELCKTAYEEKIQETENRVAIDRAFVRSIDEAVESFKKEFREVAAETAELQLLKLQKPPALTEEQKAKRFDMLRWDDPELVRNEKLSQDNLATLEKEYQKINKKITELDGQIEPHSEKIEKLKTLLSTDMSKDEFRNTKNDVDYHRQQIDLIRQKMLPYFEETARLHDEITETKRLLKMVQCALDISRLKKDSLTNYPRKIQRVRDRLEKLERERLSLEAERTKQNARWRKISGDDRDVLPPLCLRAGAEVYFI